MTSAADGSVTAIVVAFDSGHVLPECLSSLAGEGTRIIVVDNASSDASAELSAQYDAHVIRNARNEGYGRANNIGARAATSEYIFIVNPDVVVEAGTVGRLVEAARAYPDAGLLAPRIMEPGGRVFFQPRSLLSTYLQNEKGKLAVPEGDACAPFASGACFLMRRDLFVAIGGFDPAIFLFYEDDDLCRRLADQGRSIVFVPAATVRHSRGRSSAARPGRAFTARWHQAWSKAYVSRKYGLPSPAPAMFAMNALKTAAAMLTFNRKLIERYGGSAAGALAWMTGQGALQRQGLDPDGGRL